MLIELASSELNSLLNWARKRGNFPSSYELMISEYQRENLLLLARLESLESQLNSGWFRRLNEWYPGEAQQLRQDISTLTKRVASDLSQSSIQNPATSPPERSPSTNSTQDPRSELFEPSEY